MESPQRQPGSHASPNLNWVRCCRSPVGNKSWGALNKLAPGLALSAIPGAILGPLAVGSCLSTVPSALAILSILNNPARNEPYVAHTGVSTQQQRLTHNDMLHQSLNLPNVMGTQDSGNSILESSALVLVVWMVSLRGSAGQSLPVTA